MRVVPTYEQLEAEVLTLRDRLSSVEEALHRLDYHYTRLCDSKKNLDLADAESIQPAKWPYDRGWNDGYKGKNPDEEMKEDPVYMWGYKNGRGQRIAAMK
jgi:hypothetical protein